jgi:hypothetical protein
LVLDACRGDGAFEPGGLEVRPEERGDVAVGVGVDGWVRAGVLGAGAVSLDVSGNAWVSVCKVGQFRAAPRAADGNAIAIAVTTQTAIVMTAARVGLARHHARTFQVKITALRSSRILRANSDRRRYHARGCPMLQLPRGDLRSHTYATHGNPSSTVLWPKSAANSPNGQDGAIGKDPA